MLGPNALISGNGVAGVRMPDLSAPAATYTGWNLFNDRSGPTNVLSSMQGSYIPLARTAAERKRSSDPRLSIEERYHDKDQYVALVHDLVVRVVDLRYAAFIGVGFDDAREDHRRRAPRLAARAAGPGLHFIALLPGVAIVEVVEHGLEDVQQEDRDETQFGRNHQRVRDERVRVFVVFLAAEEEQQVAVQVKRKEADETQPGEGDEQFGAYRRAERLSRPHSHLQPRIVYQRPRESFRVRRGPWFQ